MKRAPRSRTMTHSSLSPSLVTHTWHRWPLYQCLQKTDNFLPPSHHSRTFLCRASHGGKLMSRPPDRDQHPDRPLLGPSHLPAGLGALHVAVPASPAPGTGLGLPASTCVRGPSCCQTRPALADKILISLLQSPEWDPISMSELGNELYSSSPFSMRKVSRRSG